MTCHDRTDAIHRAPRGVELPMARGARPVLAIRIQR